MKITGYNEDHPRNLAGSVAVAAVSVARLSLGSNSPIADDVTGDPGLGPQAAAWDHVHPLVFGSNSTRVSALSSAGSSASNSRSDHVHDGIGTVTASSSNTLDRGTLNLRPGSNVSFALSDSDGSGGFDTLTIAAAASGSGSVSYGSNANKVSATSSGGASTLVSRADHIHDGVRSVSKSGSAALVGDVTLTGGSNVTLTQTGQDISIAATGSGSLTQAYVGYNTIGGTFDTPGVNSKMYIKQVTIATDCLLASIGAHVSVAANSTSNGPSVGLYTDIAGAPGIVIAYAPALNLKMNGTARWIDVPLGAWVVAGTYWLAVRTTDLGGAAVTTMAYDTGGSDRVGTGSGGFMMDWNNVTATSTTANRFSIRGTTIR